ncbi:hypothetical protein DS838_004082 [Geotrichum bryndzae]|nr:hypothetical protein DUD61_004059 [Geotrichum candidum]KAI9211042.1 hypothetical protein DS838_004082 [Geotrichum bryndzae]
MSEPSEIFTAEEFVIPATSPRATRMSTVRPTDRLEIVTNIYTCKLPETVQQKQISVFFSHANGFVKELYEPLFDDLYHSLYDNHGIQIKYIVSFDVVNQGKSFARNEHKIGNDVIWKDFWNDVVSAHYFLQLQNHPLVRLPLFGMGHSFGGNIIFGTASIIPRMFVGVISIDGVIFPEVSGKDFILPVLAYKRRDHWPSREKARASLLRSPMIQKFDPRVQSRYFEHAFRELPTLQYPESTSGVTLATPAAQELITFSPLPMDLPPNVEEFAQTGSVDCHNAFPAIKVPKLMIMADIGTEFKDSYVEQAKYDKSLTLVFTERSHLIPLEKPAYIAGIIAPNVAEMLRAWRLQEQRDFETPRPTGIHPLYKPYYGPLVKKLRARSVGDGSYKL